MSDCLLRQLPEMGHPVPSVGAESPLRDLCSDASASVLARGAGNSPGSRNLSGLLCSTRCEPQVGPVESAADRHRHSRSHRGIPHSWPSWRRGADDAREGGRLGAARSVSSGRPREWIQRDPSRSERVDVLVVPLGDRTLISSGPPDEPVTGLSAAARPGQGVQSAPSSITVELVNANPVPASRRRPSGCYLSAGCNCARTPTRSGWRRGQ